MDSIGQAVYIWRGQGVRFLLRGSCLPALKPVYGIYISGSRCEVLIRSGVSCGCKLQLWTLKGWTVSQKYFLKILNWSQEISFSCFSSRFHLTAPSKMHGDPLKSSYFPPHKDERQRPSNQGVPDGTDWWEIKIVDIQFHFVQLGDRLMRILGEEALARLPTVVPGKVENAS